MIRPVQAEPPRPYVDGAAYHEGSSVVNDFSIVVATVNGTGSQTSNLALLRALFKMGIPVCGKNVFPSNIQGLPTWYHIRLSHQGFLARRQTPEVLVAFNRATVEQDMADLPPGGMCLVSADWRDVILREDITNYPIPVNELLREAGIKGKMRDYIANMVYLGALTQLLGVPLERIDEALTFHFGHRRSLVQQNMIIAQMAHEWTAAHAVKRDPYQVQPMDLTEGQILITGNEAAALGAIFGGITLASWYPITPSTSLIDALNEFVPKLRNEPEGGQSTCVVIQAEDELAAAGMVMGAGWAGARAMTATSGPGLSLMAEFVGLGYFAEIPAVIWDIQRVGPSTGLPTRTSQGDVLFAYYLGHGDTQNILLFPGTVAECFEYGTTAFNLAEELQTPVLVLSDLDLGMNTWMTKPFEYPVEPISRGKVLKAKDVEDRGFQRWLDVDGDGIPYRTLPGNPHPDSAYLNRGTGHNELGSYSERPEDLERIMARLKLKFDTARGMVPGPEIDRADGAQIGIIAYGSTWPAIEEARERLVAKGLATSFMRLRALPPDGRVRDFVACHERVYVVELNRDGQMHQILSLEFPEVANVMVSISRLDGMPLLPGWLTDRILSEEQGK